TSIDEQKGFKLRETMVLAQTEPLELAEQPLATPVAGKVIELATLAPDLPSGRSLIISGSLATDDGVTDGEVAVVDHVAEHDGRTTITLRDCLRNSYVRTAVTLYGNVVRATHGETLENEVLGSGNGPQANQ